MSRVHMPRLSGHIWTRRVIWRGYWQDGYSGATLKELLKIHSFTVIRWNTVTDTHTDYELAFRCEKWQNDGQSSVSGGNSELGENGPHFLREITGGERTWQIVIVVLFGATPCAG